MPKYSFKRNLFFAIWGVHDWFWPPHLTCITSATPWHHVGCTTHHAGHTAHFVGRAPRIMSAIQSNITHLVNIKFKIFLSVLAFCRVKFFFQNLLKIA